MTAKIQIFDSEEQLLFECPIEEHHRAFHYAMEMEKMGIEVRIDSPSLPETLALSLGMKTGEQKALKKSIVREIESHQ